METGTSRVKRGMAEMQKGGVIMDVMNAEQAKIARGSRCNCGYGVGTRSI